MNVEVDMDHLTVDEETLYKFMICYQINQSGTTRAKPLEDEVAPASLCPKFESICPLDCAPAI